MSPRPPSSGRAPLAAALALFVAALACQAREATPPTASRPSSTLPPLTAEAAAALADASTLYWRHPAALGAAACEPWALRFVDRERGVAHLEHAREDAEGSPATLRFTLTIAEGYLRLSAPEVEREGDRTSLHCVFAGHAELRRGDAPELDLESSSTWYLDAEACARGDTQRRMRPLGCAATLADLPSRARLLAPPTAASTTAAPPWLRRRKLFLRVDDPDGGPRCLALRRLAGPGGDHHGHLRGRVDGQTLELDYHFDGAWLTLAGPTWRRREPGRRESVYSRGCLLAEPLADDGEDFARFPRLGLYADRRACVEAPELAAPLPCLEPPAERARASYRGSLSTGPPP
jgi:hypothetical protein